VRDARGSTDITYRYSVVKGGPPPDPDTLTVRSIGIGETSYFTYPSGESHGKPWLSIDHGKLEPSPSSLYAGPDPTDPGAIARLVDTGEVREAGRERVRLHMRVQVWVDDPDLVRRMRQRLSLRLPGDEYPPDHQTTEFFDFGLERRIDPPRTRDTELLDPASPNE
jgi:hypothetical protein